MIPGAISLMSTNTYLSLNPQNEEGLQASLVIIVSADWVHATSGEIPAGRIHDDYYCTTISIVQ